MIPLLVVAAASMAASAASASASAKGAAVQNQIQSDWNRYNAQTAYNTDTANLELQSAITDVNLATLQTSSDIGLDVADTVDTYNKSLIRDTAVYNDLLYEQDIEDLWTQHGLDVEVLTLQRARERGEMVANQSAPGTTIGEGSNADVVVDQMAQENLDKFILKTGADIQASKIMNARAQSLYEAEQAVKKISYEGRIRRIETEVSTALRSTSIVAESTLNLLAGSQSALGRLNSGLSGASVQAASNAAQIRSDFTSGMIGAVGKGVSTYAAGKTPVAKTPVAKG
jgi:hypothetical protein